MGTAYDSYVQARWFHVGRAGKAVRLLVAHCTVTDEGSKVAESVARQFAIGARKASAHAVGDSDSVVECVHDGDTAFAAAGANNDGWHFEFVGQANQSPEQWADPFSEALLVRAAPYWRERADRWEIPKRWLTVYEVRSGAMGFCTHDDISKAYPKVSTGHWDPGPHFPKQHFLELVMGSDDQEDDMPPAPFVMHDKTGNRLTFVRNDLGHLGMQRNDGPWVDFGGLISSGPSASEHPNGDIVVVARATDEIGSVSILTLRNDKPVPIPGRADGWGSLGGGT